MKWEHSRKNIYIYQRKSGCHRVIGRYQKIFSNYNEVNDMEKRRSRMQ